MIENVSLPIKIVHLCRPMKHIYFLRYVRYNQGAQVGRIIACCKIVYFGHFLSIEEEVYTFWLLFPRYKSGLPDFSWSKHSKLGKI
jgi:hypothetical protein